MNDVSTSVMDWRHELEEGYQRDWRFYQPYVALCLRHAIPGPWLDLGAGLGYFVECCDRFGIPCTGYEGSEFAVAEAKARRPGLEVQALDLLQPLPNPDGSVSVVFCNQVIEHLPPERTTPFLQEIRRILAPGGLLYVGSPSRYNRAEHSDLHINLLSPGELAAHLAEAGFSDIWPADYPRPLPLPGPLGKLVSGGLFFVLPMERLSISANALAFVRDGDARSPVVRGPRYFHMRRLLSW